MREVDNVTVRDNQIARLNAAARARATPAAVQAALGRADAPAPRAARATCST